MAFAGPKNRKGEDGKPGLNGADGSAWFSDEGSPNKSLGKKGDFYLDEKTFDVYRKQTKEWVFIGNIKGRDGKNAKNGKDGKDGITTVKVIREGSFGSSPVAKGTTARTAVDYLVSDERFLLVIGATSDVTVTLPNDLYCDIEIKNYTEFVVNVVRQGGMINNESVISIDKRYGGLGQSNTFFQEGDDIWVA